MRILVTGGMGYIGTNLHATIPHVATRSYAFRGTKFELVDYDILEGRNVLDAGRIFDAIREVDAVIHLAAISGVVACNNDPGHATRVNVEGTCLASGFATALNKPFVLASSFAAENPVNVYGHTKKLAEAVVLKSRGIVCRLSNVYGGLEYLKRKNSVISFLKKCEEAGVIPELHDEGMHTRDFIHVFDVCHGLVEALKLSSGIFKICTNKQTSVRDVANLMGFKHPKSIPMPEDRKPQPAQVQSLPGWKPKISLEEGLKMMRD